MSKFGKDKLHLYSASYHDFTKASDLNNGYVHSPSHISTANNTKDANLFLSWLQEGAHTDDDSYHANRLSPDEHKENKEYFNKTGKIKNPGHMHHFIMNSDNKVSPMSRVNVDRDPSHHYTNKDLDNDTIDAQENSLKEHVIPAGATLKHVETKHVLSTRKNNKTGARYGLYLPMHSWEVIQKEQN